MRRAVALILATLALAAPAWAAKAPYTITGDSFIGKLAVRRAPTIKEMTAAFGIPTAMKKLGSQACTVTWRKRGLSIQLLDLDQTGNPCGKGGFVLGTMTSPKWRTSAGLRIGDSAARLQRIYPHAQFHARLGWWLLTRKSCQEVGAQPYGSLMARFADKKIASFVVSIAPCE